MWFLGLLYSLPVVLREPGTTVVSKPAGMASSMRVEGGGSSDISAISALRAGNDFVELPHRLDRITSGLLVAATDPDVLRWHNKAIQERLWQKYYVARLAVDNSVDVASLLGEKKVYLKAEGRTAKVVRSGGKPSFLDVLHAHEAPVEKFRMGGARAKAVDVVIRLRTGRYHQIRATMAHFGAPLLGDTMYGGKVEHSQAQGRNQGHKTQPNSDIKPLLKHALLAMPLPRDASPGSDDNPAKPARSAVFLDPHLSAKDFDSSILRCLEDVMEACVLERGGPGACTIFR